MNGTAPPVSQSGPPGRRLGRLATIALSAAVSALLVWLLLRGIDWRVLARAAVRASPAGLALYAAAAIAGLVLRAHRFRMLMPTPRPGLMPTFLVTAAQNCLTDLVPGRLASLGSYVYLLVRRFALAFETAASTFIVSFAFDFVTLGPWLVLAAAMRVGRLAPGLAERLPPLWTASFGLAFFLATAAAAYHLGSIATLGLRLLRLLLARVRLGGRASIVRILAKLDRTAEAMVATKEAGLYGRLFLVSMGIRLAKYVSLHALMASFLAGGGYGSGGLDFWTLILAISATEILASLPIPAIGQFGVWEGGMVVVLVAMGFEREPATLAAFGVHGGTQAFEYLLGVLAIVALAATGPGRDGPRPSMAGSPVPPPPPAPQHPHDPGGGP